MDRVTRLASPDGTSDYSYDAGSELTGVDHSFQTDEAYGYDSAGNRTGGGRAGAIILGEMGLSVTMAGRVRWTE